MVREVELVVGTKPERTGSVCTVKDFKLSDVEIDVSHGSANPMGGGRSTPAVNIDIYKAHVRLTAYGDEALKYRACREPHEALAVAYDQLHRSLTPSSLRSLVETLVCNAHDAGKQEGREEIQHGLRRLVGLERWEGS